MLHFFGSLEKEFVPNMKHIESGFKGQRGINLYYQGWLPDGDIKALLLICHGVAEYSGRYRKMAEYFASRGYAVYSYDFRSHGKSEGKPGYVEHFSFYLNDLEVFVRLVSGFHAGLKVFLFGHSMGAVIGLAYITKNNRGLAGLVLSGVAIKFIPHFQTLLAFLLKPLSILAPKLGMYRINPAVLSRDQTVVESYDNDPLVYRGKLSARLTVELVWSIYKLKFEIPEIKTPVLIIHGSADRLSYPEGAREVFSRIGSEDKTLKFYPGFYHEILNEPGYPLVLSDIEIWLKRLS
jgi:acylglycerol lipase